MVPTTEVLGSDPFAQLKSQQRESWSRFAPVDVMTTPPAADLVRFAAIRAGQSVLDVGCGTGVVAITARRLGARVTGIDLSPVLIERARQNASHAGLDDIRWQEGDAEALPFADGEFDVVVSQFGHMFAPRADVTAKELLRVLRPGGTIAFSTWPPDLVAGRLFALTANYLPPPPGVTPPGRWGDPSFVREQLGTKVRDLTFDHGVLRFVALSVPHYRQQFEETVGPARRIVQESGASPAKLAQFRREFEAVVEPYFRDNAVHQTFLMTRATKA